MTHGVEVKNRVYFLRLKALGMTDFYVVQERKKGWNLAVLIFQLCI
jgi:hypothetical protein